MARWLTWAWLAILMIGGGYLRAHGNGTFTFGNDEFMHLNIAKGATLANVVRYSQFETHPPLFYILLHYWMMFSQDPVFIRCFPLLFGLALIPLYYTIGNYINGRLCGLCCATLVTFSFACILQSQLIRHYCVFLLCTSLAYYCYLRWRNTHNPRILLYYIFLGWLAALSHFSAIFYFASITAFETISLLRNHISKRLLLRWLVANAAIADLALYLYHLWQPVLNTGSSGAKVYSVYFANTLSHPGVIVQSIPDWIMSSFSAPFLASFYIFPLSPALPLLGAYLYVTQFVRFTPSALRAPIALAGMGFLMSIALYMSGFYTMDEQRRNLWMLPLLMPAAGGMTAVMLKSVTRFKAGIIAGIIIVVSASYDYAIRYQRNNEYSDWQFGAWQTVTHILGQLGPHDLIITNKDGINLLTNIYRYKSDDTFMSQHLMALDSYQNTHILIDSSLFYSIPTETLLHTLRKAYAQHMLDNIDHVVFVKLWLQTPFHQVMSCAALEKEILFKSDPSTDVVLDKDFPHHYFAVFSVPTQAIIHDLLPTDGKAHRCLQTN